MTDVSLAVPDMSCGHCKAAVEKGIVAVRYVFGPCTSSRSRPPDTPP